MRTEVVSLCICFLVSLVSIGSDLLVNSNDDSGTGTLRWALETAQSGDTITFDPSVFPPDGPVAIRLSSPLPPLGAGNITINASDAGVIVTGAGLPSAWTPIITIPSSGNCLMGLKIIDSPGAGIQLCCGASSNIIGGDPDSGTGPYGQGNYVCNSTGEGPGINITDPGTSGNLILGNIIGAWDEQDSAHGNGTGIYVMNGASDNTIGPSNVIAYNREEGIQICGSLAIGNTITRNQIFANGFSDILLSNGGNKGLEAPLLEYDSGDIQRIEGTAGPGCLIELFALNVSGESAYLGFAPADDTGAFGFLLDEPEASGRFAATATDGEGNTSPLSTTVQSAVPSTLVAAGLLASQQADGTGGAWNHTERITVDYNRRNLIVVVSFTRDVENALDTYRYTLKGSAIALVGGFSIQKFWQTPIDLHAPPGWQISADERYWFWEGLSMNARRSDELRFSIAVEHPSNPGHVWSHIYVYGGVGAQGPQRLDFEIPGPMPVFSPFWTSSAVGTTSTTGTEPAEQLDSQDRDLDARQVAQTRLDLQDGIIGSCHTDGTTGLTWEFLGGPPGGIGYDIKVRPDDPDIMYVTDANSGIYISVDSGETWLKSNAGIVGTAGVSSDLVPVFCVTVDPNDSTIVWLGLQNKRGIYRSEDAGITWNLRVNGISEESGLTIRGISVEPGNSDVVYAAGELSSSAWAGVGLTGHMFDLTKGVVYKSTDAGEHWTEVWRGDNLARYVCINPLDPSILYVSTGIFDREAANTDAENEVPGGVGIVRSIDGGETWQILDEENGLMGLYVGSLQMHSDDPRTLLAGVGHDYWYDHGHPDYYYRSPAGVYMTSDGGDTWEKRLTATIFSVEYAPSNPDIVYAAGDREFYRSEDGGVTWWCVSGGEGDYWGPPGIVAGFPIDIQVDPRDPMRLFVNNYGGGNYMSQDGGRTWVNASTGYSGASVDFLLVDPSNAQNLLCGAASGLFESTDRGQTWEGLAYQPARATNITALAVDPSDPDHIISHPWDIVALPVSYDGGTTWERIPIRDAHEHLVTALAFAPSNSDTVYAGRGMRGCDERREESCPAGGGIDVSHDSGLTWSEVDDPLIRDKHVVVLAVHPHDSRTVFAGTLYHGAYLSSDGGDTWESLALGLSSVLALAVDSEDPRIIYAGGWGGIYRSDDGGETWMWASGGLEPETCVRALEIDASRGAVWCGDFRGVHISYTQGDRWEDINDGLTTENVTSLALASDGTVIYAGTNGQGVFRLDLSSPEGPQR